MSVVKKNPKSGWSRLFLLFVVVWVPASIAYIILYLPRFPTEIVIVEEWTWGVLDLAYRENPERAEQRFENFIANAKDDEDIKQRLLRLIEIEAGKIESRADRFRSDGSEASELTGELYDLTSRHVETYDEIYRPMLDSPRSAQVKVIGNYLSLVAGPPIGVYLLWLVVSWVGRGFRDDTS